MISYKEIKEFSIEDLVSLFTSVGWVEESAKYPERLQSAIRNSDVVFSAWKDEKLIGLLSAIDDTMHAYGIYLLINPKYQGQGVGRKLFEMFDTRYKGYKKEFKTVKTQEYYKRFGYEVDSVGMVKNELDLK